MYGYSQSQRLFSAPSRWHDTRKWYPKAIRTFLQQLCALATRQESASTEPKGTVTDIDVTRVTAIDFLPSSIEDDEACTVVVWCTASAESGSRICYVARLRYGFRYLLTHSFCFPELRYTTQAPAHALLRELVAFYVQDDYDMVAIAALLDAQCVILRLECDALNPGTRTLRTHFWVRTHRDHQRHAVHCSMVRRMRGSLYALDELPEQ
jgi:hypothetical protein